MNLVDDLLGPQSINYFCRKPDAGASKAITHSFHISIGVKARNIVFKNRKRLALKTKINYEK